MTAVLHDTSKLHKIEGINYQRKNILEIKDLAQSAPNGDQPLPEAILWLLLTGEYPSEKELELFQREMNHRCEISSEVENQIKSFSNDLHPMTQLSMGIMACQPYSYFLREYHEGMPRTKYWEPTLEDGLNVIAKLSKIAAIIYNKQYTKVSLDII